MTEPVCWNGPTEYRREGYHDDDPPRYTDDGPHADCSCDVCFKGHRQFWLDGVASRDAEVAALDQRFRDLRSALSRIEVGLRTARDPTSCYSAWKIANHALEKLNPPIVQYSTENIT